VLFSDADVSQWSPSDVHTWLVVKEMPHVADLFRTANVTGAVLVHGITDDDLIRIGVSEPLQRLAVLLAIKQQLIMKRGL